MFYKYLCLTVSEPRRVGWVAGFYSFMGLVYEILRAITEGATEAAPAAADELFLDENYFFIWSNL